MSETETATTVSITVDGKTIEAREGELVIDAAERHGTYIPRFCHHPRMNPVGMCRMCIVEIDTGRGPALQPSCMIPVADGMTVVTDSDVTKKAQDGVLEFLLANHPLDCPVCDKGGECPLQDQAYSYGPGESRFIEEKRHFEKPIPISDLVNLDRERCILCDRCTRFSKEVAGDTLIHFQDRGNQTQVNTFPDHPFASYFSGNTVQICPVGALTAEPYRFKARPWDLDQTESTCTSCAVGCRVVVQASRNEVLRTQGVDVDGVNWGWLCDKGRFDFQKVHADGRLEAPLVRDGDELVAASWSDALTRSATALRAALDASGPGSVAVLGGARLTNEAAYAWAKLAKGVLGTDHVDARLGDGLDLEVLYGLPRATIDDVCAPGGATLVVGVDAKDELPVLYLRLRHAAVEDGVPLVEIVPRRTGLSEVATATLTPGPGGAAEVAAAVASGATVAPAGVDADALAAAVAAVGDGPIRVVLGRGNLAESAQVASAVAGALIASGREVTFLPAMRRGNVHGAIDSGLAPGVLPGRVSLVEGRAAFHEHWSTVPAAAGLDATGILGAAASGRLDVLVLLGADPLADFPDADLAARALAGARTVIAVDTTLTGSSRAADVVLAAAGWAETEGSTTNLEGRVSRVGQKVTPPGTARADWAIAAELALRLGDDLGVESVDDLLAELASVTRLYAGVDRDAIGMDGVCLPLPVEVAEPDTDAEAEADADADAEAATDTGETADSEAVDADASTDGDPAPVALPEPGLEFVAPTVSVTTPDGYKLRLVAYRSLYDLGVGTQTSPSLAGLAPGGAVRLHPHDFDRLGVTDGTVVTVHNRDGGRGAVAVPAHADAGVPRGVAAVAFNQPGGSAAALIDATTLVTEVRVEVAR